MNTLKFKTNIKCEGCISVVQKPLNETFGEENWKVDLASSDKELSVNTDDKALVINTLKEAGYIAEELG